jgi:copper homeostasis protein
MAEPNSIIVEACVACVAAAVAVEQSGADRIEFNSALELDGLTPLPGVFSIVVSKIRIPIIAMARPRAGNFVYSDSEWDSLLADARWLIENGADGIAFGCLDDGGAVQLDRCREMRDLVGSKQLVFHKAFDVTSNWKLALDGLVEAGVNRVMTSGQAPTASGGAGVIAEAIRHVDGAIEVLPAGGINSSNASEIVAQTGANQLHGSFSGGPRSAENVDKIGQISLEIEASISRLRESS